MELLNLSKCFGIFTIYPLHVFFFERFFIIQYSLLASNLSELFMQSNFCLCKWPSETSITDRHTNISDFPAKFCSLTDMSTLFIKGGDSTDPDPFCKQTSSVQRIMAMTHPASTWWQSELYLCKDIIARGNTPRDMATWQDMWHYSLWGMSFNVH